MDPLSFHTSGSLQDWHCVLFFPKENSCWDLTDPCPLVPPALPLLPIFVPSTAHPSAIRATLDVFASISGNNSVLVFSNLSSCHLLLVLFWINISK